jgi:hypothetical protein
MKKLFCIIILIFTIPAVSNSKHKLIKAVRNGISKHLKVKSLLINHKIDEINLRKSKKNKLFTINFSSNYLYKSEKMEIILPDFKEVENVESRAMVLGSNHNFDLKVQLLQPIYRGDILNNKIKLRKLRIIIGELGINLGKLRVESMIKTCYLNYQCMIQKKKALNTSRKDIINHIEKLETLFKEKLIGKSALLESKVKLEEFEMKIIGIENFIDIEKRRFKRLTDMDVSEMEGNYTEEIPTKQEGLAFFMINHPNIKLFRYLIKEMHLIEKIVDGFYTPQISAFLETHYGKPGINFFLNKWSLYFQGGIKLSMKLYNGGVREDDKMLIGYRMEKLSNQAKDYIEEVKEGLDSLFISYNKLNEKLVRIAKIKSLIKSDLYLKETLFLEKQINNSDFLSAILKKDQYDKLESEIKLSIELMKVKINNLISRRMLK